MINIILEQISLNPLEEGGLEEQLGRGDASPPPFSLGSRLLTSIRTAANPNFKPA